MNGKSIVLWSLSLSLVGLFCAAGYAKIIGAPQMVECFQKFGYSESFRMLIGAIEIAGAALLIFPKTSAAAAWILVCVMLGAMGSHLTHHEYLAALVPVVIGFACLVVAFLRRPARRRRLPVLSMRDLDSLWERERQLQSIRGGR